MSEKAADDPEFEFQTTGEKLKAAREAKEMSLEDVAGQTRVQIKHLEAIEAGAVSDLPGRTYALGFAKSYARVVGLDEREIANSFREEIDEQLGHAPRAGAVQYELDEPSKVPSSRLAWIAAGLGFLLLIAGFAIWRTWFFPGASDAEFAAAASGEQGAAPVAASQTDGSSNQNAASMGSARPAAARPDPKGEVVFTANIDNVWVKFYDGNGDQLMQKQMALGEQYVVPADAVNPQVWTGRPDAFIITIGGKTVAPLGTAEKAVRNVPVSAEALLARKPEPVLPASGNGDASDQAGPRNGAD
ncbi:MAG: DUF4115 domain-containing protein [Blastomonas sp.]